MEPKILKTEAEYEAALAYVDTLMSAEAGSPEVEELELFAMLIEQYEEEHYPIDLPDPVEVIKFRMDQQGLEPKGLIPYIGSQSKISEVLNYKRPLSLSMIRKLHSGLEIPLEVLVQPYLTQVETVPSAAGDYQYEPYPYFNCLHRVKENQLEPLWDWRSRTEEKASRQPLPPFKRERLDEALFKELVRLSAYSAGPQMAGELLNKKGIYLIIQKFSGKTEIDGACFFTPDGRPVISLTLRDNRLDYFWLTLFHLLAHLYLHGHEKWTVFFDSIPCVFERTAPAEEQEANRLLKDFLYPSPGSKTLLQNYIRNDLKTRDRGAFEQVVDKLGTGPEMVWNLVRLEQDKVEPVPPIFTPRKVNERLEVTG